MEKAADTSGVPGERGYQRGLARRRPRSSPGQRRRASQPPVAGFRRHPAALGAAQQVAWHHGCMATAMAALLVRTKGMLGRRVRRRYAQWDEMPVLWPSPKRFYASAHCPCAEERRHMGGRTRRSGAPVHRVGTGCSARGGLQRGALPLPEDLRRGGAGGMRAPRGEDRRTGGHDRALSLRRADRPPAAAQPGLVAESDGGLPLARTV